MFEGIGNLKFPAVQFSNRNTYKFFNSKQRQVTKAFFFGDSNHSDLILVYDFATDHWSRTEVPANLSL
jgi:hypothetical protein